MRRTEQEEEEEEEEEEKETDRKNKIVAWRRCGGWIC